MMITPTGWDTAVRPDDVTQRVLGAVSYVERWAGVLDAGVKITPETPITVLTPRQHEVLLAYLELHFGIHIPVAVAEDWQTAQDIAQTVRGLAPRGMLEEQGLEMDLQDVLVAVSPDRKHYITPFIPIQNLFGTPPTPCDGRVVVTELTPDELVGRTFSAGGINQLVTDVDAAGGWTYIQVTVLMVFRLPAGQPTHRQLAGRNWAVNAAGHAMQSLPLIEPGTCLVDDLPNVG